jgi:hypothetical protein
MHDWFPISDAPHTASTVVTWGCSRCKILRRLLFDHAPDPSEKVSVDVGPGEKMRLSCDEIVAWSVTTT